jgi:hypothetical protein
MNLQSVPVCSYSVYHGNKPIWRITEIKASKFLGVKNRSMSINVFTFPCLIHNFAKLILEIFKSAQGRGNLFLPSLLVRISSSRNLGLLADRYIIIHLLTLLDYEICFRFLQK